MVHGISNICGLWCRKMHSETELGEGFKSLQSSNNLTKAD